MYMFQIKCLYLVICMFIQLYHLDANTQGTLNTPDDAYRYAKGKTLSCSPITKIEQAQEFKIKSAIRFCSCNRSCRTSWGS